MPIKIRKKTETEETEEEMEEAEACFYRGNEQYLRGDFEDAVASFDQAINFKPDKHEAWYNRGVALFNLERYEDVVASFDQAIKFKPDKHEAWFNRGAILCGYLERYEDAVASFDQAIKFKPDKHEAWFNRGWALGNLERYEEAVASYDQAIKLKPDYYEAWSNRGLALFNLERYEDAVASFDQAINFKPHKHEDWNNRGVILCGYLERYEDAVASFDQAIKFKPDKHEAWFNRGWALGNLERYEDAVASFDQAIKLKPDYYEAWSNRGLALFNLERYEDAVASFDQAIKFKPDKHEAWFNRGWALGNLGRYEDAVASFDQAINFKPDKHEAWSNRGLALDHLERYEEAVASCDQAIKLKPHKHEAWYNRGLALVNLERYEDAVASYDQAINFKPDYHEAWNNRGAILSNYLERYEEAVASYDQAINFKPDKHEAWYNRGLALGNLGRYEDAVASYDQAIKFKADFHLAWINRGIAAGKSVNYDQFPSLRIGIVQKNPVLNQRGYEGKLISYQEGLKHCPQETHPEGWGLLNKAIGNAHYYRGCGDSRPRSYWNQAANSYNQALQTLTEDAYPEEHLEVLQDLSRVRLKLGKTAKAEELQRLGKDVLHNLLTNTKSPAKRKQLALKFASFQQLTVDLAVQSGNWCAALEIAEKGKNACLSWLLDGWSDDISSPKWTDIQQLLNPTTSIVYWHLSPAALHTFILTHNSPSPIVLGETKLVTEDKLRSQKKRLYDFEKLVEDWNKQYYNSDQKQEKDPNTPQFSRQDNRENSPPGNSENSKPLSWEERGLERGSKWQDNLPQLLKQLKNILDIPSIIQSIQNSIPPYPPLISRRGDCKSHNLILIPHRDLHRFPLHALFPDTFTITYLPSAKIGLSVVGKAPTLPANNYHELSLLSVEYPASKNLPILEFAEVESEAICQIFSNPYRLSSENATREAVRTALHDNYNIFHFTGHGKYEFSNPALSFRGGLGEL